jgi:hypothetical protein
MNRKGVNVVSYMRSCTDRDGSTVLAPSVRMARKKRRQPLPAAFRDRHKCKDCGVNVLTTGEYYMVSADMWERQCDLGYDDNLCIGCLESRIGRKLKGPFGDFICFPNYPWMYPASDRMMDRYGFVKNAKGELVHPGFEKQQAHERARRNARRRRAYAARAA